MAQIFSWLCFVLVALNAVASNAENEGNAFPIDRQLDPVHQGQYGNDILAGDSEDRGDREKRLGVIKKIGLKAGLLDFVFGKIDSFIDSKTRFINELDKQNIIKNQKYFGITPPPKVHPQNNLRTTTPAPVDFPVNSSVSLVIPDRLFGNSFTLVTNASKIISDVIYNTADRAQELADRVNSNLRHKFGFKRKVISVGIGPVNKPNVSTRVGIDDENSSSSSSASSSSSSSSSINSLNSGSDSSVR